MQTTIRTAKDTTMESLNALDVFSLSDSSNNHVVIKDNCFSDFSDGIVSEIQELWSADLAVSEPSRRIFQEAGIGKGDTNQINSSFRSDLRCWLTPDLCKEHKLDNVEQLIKRLIKICSPLKREHHLNGDYSVQLTVYPGNGAHYVRHLDTFQIPSLSTFASAKKSHRRITMLYYLNSIHKGGQLRVFTSTGQSVDIDPIMNRLVVFRSDKVEHEVLPCYSDRFAISLWASSSLPPAAPFVPQVSGPVIDKAAVNCNTNLSSTSSTHNLTGPPPLSLPSHVLSDLCHPSHSASIFVSLVNYRDSEGPHTILDLFRRASHPERIFLGTVFQGDLQADSDCHRVPLGFTSSSTSTSPRFDLPAHVRTLLLPHQQARGPCLARSLAMTLWQGERYFLQIDSHMRFREGWDSYLIYVLETIRSSGRVAKPVLTTYPLGYTLPNNVPNDTRPTVLFPTKFDEDGILRQTARIVEPVPSSSGSPRLVLKSPLWASGFSFSDSSLISEVPYNPHLHYLFFGEEVSMAARMFTHGYDFFSPTQNVLYHLYSRAHRPTFQEVQPLDKNKLRSESQSSVRRLLGMPDVPEVVRVVDLKYGLGDLRTLGEFELSLSVKFASRSMDNKRDWNQYINSGNNDETVKYRFVDSSNSGTGTTIKNIEELFAENSGETSAKKQDDLSSLLQSLAGLDRVKEFLNGST